MSKSTDFKIVSLTVNPSIDKSTRFEGLVSEQKIRCETPKFDSGGGGINVSKAIRRLGGESLAVFTSGGYPGQLLNDLLNNEDIPTFPISISQPTRENFIAVDTLTGLQYRFGMPGPNLNSTEEEQVLESIKSIKPQYLVASGSLPPGLSDGFYNKVARIAKKIDARFVLDTSGDALKSALREGVYLLKPNLGELASLVGAQSLELNEVEKAARELISKSFCEIVVVSMGPKGAQLVTSDISKHIPAPVIKVKSTVGAGDSMVGGMIWALSQNKSPVEVVQYGIACGSAATMNEGTQLFVKEDAIKLFDWIQHNS